MNIDKVQQAISLCRNFIMMGEAAEIVARDRGHKDRADGFRNRTECMEDILRILEEKDARIKISDMGWE